MTSRKERRALQHERERLGLPKAKPWEHQKAIRLCHISELMAAQDRELAAQLGVSVGVVQQIRKSVTRERSEPESVVQS